MVIKWTETTDITLPTLGRSAFGEIKIGERRGHAATTGPQQPEVFSAFEPQACRSNDGFSPPDDGSVAAGQPFPFGLVNHAHPFWGSGHSYSTKTRNLTVHLSSGR
jgi:hypothetical protein